MGITSILAILGIIEEIIKDTPEALGLFQSVRAMLINGTEPTVQQWAALDASMKSHHDALQAA